MSVFTVPKEVIKFLAQRKCPLCKTSLSVETNNEVIVGSMNQLSKGRDTYFANTSCFECDNYTIEAHYLDPKYIILAIEWLSLQDEAYRYDVLVLHDEPSTQISVYLKGENLDEDRQTDVLIKGHPLELGKSSIKTLIGEIRTLLMLA